MADRFGTRLPASTDEAIFENVIRTNLNAAFFTVNTGAASLQLSRIHGWCRLASAC
jgi:hypothetical protein